jgi:hypothetical protein
MAGNEADDHRSTETPTAPGRQRPRLPGSPVDRRLLAAAGLVVVALVVVTALAMPGAGGPAGTKDPAGSAVSAAHSAAPTASTPIPPSSSPRSPTPHSTTSPQPSSSPDAFAVDGWPIAWSDDTATPLLGPDGTLYLSVSKGDSLSATLIAVGPTGSAGTRRQIDGTLVDPAQVSPDGTLYYISESPVTGKTVYAYGAGGSPLTGWPVAGISGAVAGPSGTLYAELNGQVVGIAADGTIGPELTGVDPCVVEAPNLHFTRSDGTVFALCWTNSNYTLGRVVVVDTAGQAVSPPDQAQWSGMAIGPDGTVVVWRRNETPDGDRYLVRDTQVAVVNDTGTPLAGWPVTLPGAVSMPAVGADGTVYLSLAGERARVPQVAALRAGHSVPGWPYRLPAGYQPRTDTTGQPGRPSYPVPPIVGPDGGVFVVADKSATSESIFAIDRGGHLRPGWPATLPSRIDPLGAGVCTDWCGTYYQTPLVGTSAGGSPLLYVHTGNKILAFDQNGRLAPGWPKTLGDHSGLAAYAGWTWWSVTPDGGLAAAETLPASDMPNVNRLWRWFPDGLINR